MDTLFPRALLSFFIRTTWLIPLILFSFNVNAGTFLPGTYGIDRDDGSIERFQVELSSDTAGQAQVTWWHVEDRVFSPDTRTPVLFGRDLDSNGKPDAWFYRDENGLLQSEERTSRRQDGWDTAHALLTREMRLTDRWLLAVGMNAIFSKLSFTIDHLNRVEASILEEELDIRTLEIRIRRLVRENPRNPAIPLLNGLISRAYNDLVHRLESDEYRNLFASLAGDAALLFLTGGSGRLFVQAEAWIATQLGRSTAITTATATLNRATAGMSARASQLATRAASQALARTEVQVLSRLLPKEAIRVALTGLSSRSKVAQAASQVLTQATGVIRAGASQWKYIGITQSIQVAAEMLSRGEELWDPNPIVMAEKISTNEEFIQNFLYMSNETFWMAGLSTYFQTPGKRIVSCALMSLVNSNVMNYAIKGSVDPTRATFDTGWEVIVGNAQTQVDLAALRTLENAVQRTGNSRLRLLGYLFVVADQGAGYYGYSRASIELESRTQSTSEGSDETPSIETHVIPVLGPS